MRSLAASHEDEALWIHRLKARFDQPAPTHVYRWGNNLRRAELKGRLCRVLARGNMGTILIEFPDTGERVTTSHKAIRPI